MFVVIERRVRRGRALMEVSRLKGAVGSAIRLAITLEPVNIK